MLRDEAATIIEERLRELGATGGHVDVSTHGCWVTVETDSYEGSAMFNAELLDLVIEKLQAIKAYREQHMVVDSHDPRA